MKIAQIAPLAESVPPWLHDQSERVVSYLTEELVRLGHEVTPFAGADAASRARPEFDLLHFHAEVPRHFSLFRDFADKTLTTLHGRLDRPDLPPLFREFAAMPVVSVSHSQRGPLPAAHWVGTVHHGLSAEVCPFNPVPRGRYLAFLGRIAPDTGVERAIDIARAAGARLRIAARVEAADAGYFRERIAPRLGGAVEFLGELPQAGQHALLGNAAGLLFPVDWPVPFSLAMIEAMACGTPVLAWRNGAVPEVIEHGVSGFVVDSVDEAAALVPRLVRLDRGRVRARFDARFTAERMARDYLAVYRTLGRRALLKAVEAPGEVRNMPRTAAGDAL